MVRGRGDRRGVGEELLALRDGDLLEHPQRPFEVSDGIVALTLRPFELVTLRLTVERG